MAESEDNLNPILHVLVVGFHHKKGCQLEYSYPPLREGSSVDSQDLPEQWKHLPSLALPDGAHNFDKDTVFFLLRAQDDANETVFGVSCCRQMNASELINRTADVTRSTVQKSVCVLSRLPLFGLIQSKLELITHAYFNERDFSQVALLEETYNNLNASLSASCLTGTQVFLSLSVKELIIQFRHKIVVLFKLIMLERRVLFCVSPVKKLCGSILTLLSLYPGMIAHGLKESACYSPLKQLSPTFKVTQVGSDLEEFLEVNYKEGDSPSDAVDAVPSGAAEKDSSVHHNDSAKENSAQSQPEPEQEILNKKNKEVRNLEKYNPDLSMELNINAITHIEPVQSLPVNMGTSDSILSQSPRKSSEGERDPLGNIEEITTVESVQLPEALVNNTIHPLDSPESIRQIDKEDCFSWEEDKLLLEIDEILEVETESEQHIRLKEEEMELSVKEEKRDKGEKEFEDQKQPQLEVPTTTDLTRTDSKTSINSKDSTSSNTSNTASYFRTKLSAFSPWSQQKAAEKGIKIEMMDIRPLSPTNLKVDEFGFPLAIFTKGSLCHPYLSLQYYDLLQDVNVRSLCIGATNILFKQKKHLTDVIVEVEEARVDIHDPELRRQLNLTTADLRFADYLLKAVSDEKGDIFLDDTEWEGGDEWLRAQFKLYLNSLISCVEDEDEKALEDFNPSFVNAWKTTHNYKQWRSGGHSLVITENACHPCQGQLGMMDMKLKLTHNLQNTERGKRISAAATTTGKYVVQTGKVVGGAISTAKSAVSSWFSGLAQEWKQEPKALEGEEEKLADDDEKKS